MTGLATQGAVVQFEHVSKSYDPAATRAKNVPGAVNDLSLTVPAGKICILVGPSGCGKTTSLKMVNRLIEPTSGRITIDGVDITTRELTALRRGIGYVIQQVGLFPHQTIGENVATVPRLLGWPKARLRERSEELMGLVGLDPAKYRDRYPSQLSGGERQRVGVARALAADPPIMLMDEPFGAVDPIVRDRLQNEFLRLQESIAKTILFVTHDIDEAIKMGDLVAVFQTGGILAQFGTPLDILAAPASEFVARFVGQDRGLKRLSLLRVADVELAQAVTARPGDSAADARRRALDDPLRYLLLIDASNRPLGWVSHGDIPAEGVLTERMANPVSPVVNKRTTLKDALSMMLDADVQTGIVVDRTGAVQGLLTIDAVARKMRDGEHAPAFDRLAVEGATGEPGEDEAGSLGSDDPGAGGGPDPLDPVSPLEAGTGQS
ncbi:MAG: osmoprotectant transport system ATP-binding protein [Chloroflexota bacterium]|jgi:osmoprotectant transport system ATP-binding protein|nr:osmoprotectant transport system ATP-binding protein [Chloroflexota bacterium]